MKARRALRAFADLATLLSALALLALGLLNGSWLPLLLGLATFGLVVWARFLAGKKHATRTWPRRLIALLPFLLCVIVIDQSLSMLAADLWQLPVADTADAGKLDALRLDLQIGVLLQLFPAFAWLKLLALGRY